MTDLTEVEAEVSDYALAGLASQRIPSGYDLRHLQAFHRAIVGDLYRWAGSCAPSRSPSRSCSACPTHHHLRRLGREAFVDRLTYFAGEINALHPFRDGRTQRAFLGQLARDADHRRALARPARGPGSPAQPQARHRAAGDAGTGDQGGEGPSPSPPGT